MRFTNNNTSLSANEILHVAKSNLAEWQEHALLNDADRDFIASLDDDGIVRSFSKVIGFGTAGLRGKMLPGIANMNRETVGLATYALAETVIEAGGSDNGVVIACDSRNNSELYSRLSACVLAALGIKVYIFDSLRPTPELSFAIRHLGCKAGINVTASHNTKEYNGYKVYWEDGAQLPPIEAKKVADKFLTLDIWKVPTVDFDKAVSEGKITVIGSEVDEAYLKNVLEQSPAPDMIKKNSDKVKILYTPLHGAGHLLAPEALKRAGFKCVKTVDSQIAPDGDFPTVERPNPQFIAAFNEAIAVSEGYDVIIANDPDADRMGVALKNKNGKFEALTGNQIALILINYIIKARRANGTMPTNPAMVKSIVSSKLAEVICDRNGIKTFDVYTGFKYIGEKIKEFEKTGAYNFIFGFEESYGYLTGTYARDKDGIAAALLIAEAALDAKISGKTLFEVLDGIYEEYGFWGEYWGEAILTSPDFTEEMASIMLRLRNEPPAEIAGIPIERIADYLSSTVRNVKTGEVEAIPFAPENVLTYILEDGSSITVRPSGTEPKIKLYYFISSKNEADSLEKRRAFEEYFNF
ncbi:MAG: phospho-sugar mutase [Clostridia bacterium]|nr:phospho-sugar mutase [Clostridia bacterium]